jgi:hypothetical protein
MFAIVSDAVPGFDFLAFFGTIAVVLGAFYGGYCCWTLGLDVAQATKATAYARGRFSILPEILQCIWHQLPKFCL